MKTIQVKSFFKKVSDKSSPKFGQKREDLHWSFDGMEADTIRAMDSETLEKVATLANATLESFGRKLILQNADDWDFDPSDIVTIDTCYKDLTSETTRKRKVTKESLAKCGAFYGAWAHLIGKESKASSAGEKVIAAKLQPIASNTDALEVMKSNIVELLEKVAEESENNIKLAEDFEANADCLEWVIDECEKLVEDSKVDIASAL
jgi:hypothetical protein